MYPAYGNIRFSIGDLIIDLERKEIGILVKKSKILKVLNLDEEITQKHQDNINCGWEIMWIKENSHFRKVGIFEGLDRILSEDTMRLSICAGVMEHHSAGSKMALDFELDRYEKENAWI